MLLLTSTEVGGTAFIASMMIARIGYALSFSLVAEVAPSAVPAERAGAAGSIAESSNELGKALGITLLGSLAALNFRLTGTLNETLDHVGIAPEAAAQAKEAFLTGLHIVVGVGGLLTPIVGIIAWHWLPRKLREQCGGRSLAALSSLWRGCSDDRCVEDLSFPEEKERTGQSGG